MEEKLKLKNITFLLLRCLMKSIIFCRKSNKEEAEKVKNCYYSCKLIYRVVFGYTLLNLSHGT